MQSENKTPPTLDTYLNNDLNSSADEVKDIMIDSGLPSLEEIKDNFGKSGSVVKWIAPVPDNTTANGLNTETKDYESTLADFSEKELTEAENNLVEPADELTAEDATVNYNEDIF